MRRSGPGLALLVAAPLAWGGCHEIEVYAFTGQRYDETAQCLLPKSVIDVIEGKAGPTCPGAGVRCYEGPTGEVYVSPACEAPPGYLDRTDDPHARKCRLALDANLGGGACPDA